jgi:CubicO group peptidase (beta-lactamase class C family)
MLKKPWSLGVLTLAAIVLIVLIFVFRPDHTLRVVTGIVAHDMCSKTFTSGLDPQSIMAETMTRSGISRLKWLISYQVDRTHRTVSAAFAGLLRSRALFRDGLGCVLVHQALAPVAIDVASTAPAATAAALLPPIAGPAIVAPSSELLRQALDHAFEEPPSPPLRRTKAVIIVAEGRVIGERYAPGIGIDTPLMGFSLTKSVVNALLGVLVQQGRLTPSQPAPIAEWQAPSDPRRAITIEHLMRMSSGLALDETNTGFDVSSRMLYLYDDMAAFAAKAPLIATPGTRWAYSSPSTVLLSRIIGETLGGRPEETLAFARRHLFQPLGIQDVTLEFDAAGTFIGNSYAFASARDWARLGLLYLNDGEIAGQRLLPPGWVEFSARATLGMYYAAGFWTLRSEHPWAKRWAELGIPGDAFFGSGDLGQRLVILPTQRLIVVRLGDAVDPTGDMRGLARLIREVLAATMP